MKHTFYRLDQTKQFQKPIVYALADVRDGIIRYVGQTKKAGRRFETYRAPKHCHNPQLSKWLLETGDHARFIVLADNPDDINAVERRWIKHLSAELFNLDFGGAHAWRAHVSMPWSAGRGNKCPSDIFLLRLQSRRTHVDIVEKVKTLRRIMTPKQRCIFEIQIAMDLYHMARNEIDGWLAVTRDKILPIIEPS